MKQHEMNKGNWNEPRRRNPRAWIAAMGLGVMGLGAMQSGCSPAAAADATGALPGAGAPDASGPDGTTLSGSDYLPLAIGATWTYRISNAAGMMADKMTTIEAVEPEDGSNGPVAFRLRNEALDGTTINWEQLSGTAYVRYRQQALDASGNLVVEKTYSPSSVVFDEAPAHVVAGATWAETYAETKPGATGVPKASQEFVKWTVESTDDVVMVPAGTFTCIRVRRHHTSSNNPADEVTWYAPGKGRVKQTGGGTLADQTRELIGFSSP